MSSVSFSGIASGIDGDAIIQATIDGRRLSKVPLENKVANNNAEVASLDKLKELVLNLEKKLREFASFSGGALSKTVVSSNENAVTAAVSANAVPGTLTFSVQQLASSARVTFDHTYSSIDELVAPGMTEKGTLSISLGSGASRETVEIEVDETTTVSSLALKVSEVMPGKVSASMVNVGTEDAPQYRLMLTTLETGLEKANLEISLDANLQSSGLLSGYQLSQAKDAIVHVDGIGTIQRGRNTINDIIPGVSLELKEETTAPVSIKISSDSSKTATRVSEFVEAYNEIVKFINQENKIQRVENGEQATNEYGSLSRTRVDNQLLNSLRGAISGTNLDQEGGVRIFADLGITTDNKTGELLFDKDVFEKAMAKNPNDVSNLLQSFGDKVASTGGIINNFTTYNGLFDQVKNSKKTLNDSITKRLEQIERSIEQQRDFLKKMFSRLEETIGQLNSNATALSGIANLPSRK